MWKIHAYFFGNKISNIEWLKSINLLHNVKKLSTFDSDYNSPRQVKL